MEDKQTKVKQYTDSLRAIADWYDAHPEIELPVDYIDVYNVNTKEEAATILKALSPCEKEYLSTMFYIKKSFGAITLRFCFYRNQVCERIVVGKKIIPAQRIEAQDIPERVEDIVEFTK